MLLDARNALIAWIPGSDSIRVGSLIWDGESTDWTNKYSYTGGAANIWLRSSKDDEIGSFFKSEFIAVVFRDGVCPLAAYREFSKITQFVDAVPRDMPERPNLFGASFLSHVQKKSLHDQRRDEAALGHKL